MPFFQYRARDKNGALITGTIEASDITATEAALGSRGLIPIKVTAKSEAPVKLPNIAGWFQTTTPQDLILFSRQLATLFAAGVPLTRSLFTLETQMRNALFVSVIKAVREINPNLGLKEAKDLSEKPGAVVAENVNKASAEEA